MLTAAKKHLTGAMFYPLGVGKTENIAFYVHPASASVLDNLSLDCVLFHEIVYTSKAYMRCVSAVDYTLVEKHLEQMGKVNVERLCGPLNKPKPVTEDATEKSEATTTVTTDSRVGEKRARPEEAEKTPANLELPKDHKADLARARFLERQQKKKK